MDSGRKEGRMEGRKEMFYLTIHSTHFYLLLYGVDRITREETAAATT